LGYPIIYKAIVGLGHAPHPVANQLGLAFFEHALSLKGSRTAWDGIDHKTPVSMGVPPRPWPRSYSHPFAYGDIVNQEVFPFGQQDMIPEKYRTPLPTEEIMHIWQKI
jgi:hypothetical protein